MPFTLERFISTRPYLYHLTSASNSDRILRSRKLVSAAILLQASGEEEWLRKKRKNSKVVEVDGQEISIRDQQPLYEGKSLLKGGWTFKDLIESLNSRVFFWPGLEEKPVDSGQRHFERYVEEEPVILRVRTAEMLQLNAQPLFCKYNSGSPRTTKGKGSPRGPATFVTCSDAPYTASNVVEVTFKDEANLPKKVEYSGSTSGPWEVA